MPAQVGGAWSCLDATVVLTTGVFGTKGVELAFGHLLWGPGIG